MKTFNMMENYRYNGPNPVTFKAPTEEEQKWFMVTDYSGPSLLNVITNTEFLHNAGIRDWYWVDREYKAVYDPKYFAFYFKHEKDLMFFNLGKV